MGVVGLKTHIWSNNFKSLLLLCGFPVLLVGLIYALELLMMAGGLLPSTGNVATDMGNALAWLAAGVPLALVVSLVWFVIAYFSNQWIIDLSTGAHRVERKDQPDLYNMLENLAISRGMRTPALRIIEADEMNAFATGLHEGQYSVTLTRGLMNALTPAEMEAVLAHEMTHVINRDVRLIVIASVFAGIITLLAQVIFRSVTWGRAGGNRKVAGVFILIALAAAAVGYLLAVIIKMAISRRREFMADAGSVELTKNPDAMISALRKISGHSHLPAPGLVRGLFLDDHNEGVMGLFATHPPIGARIEALVKYAGGHDLPPPEASSTPATEAASPATISDPAPGRGPWG